MSNTIEVPGEASSGTRRKATMPSSGTPIERTSSSRVHFVIQGKGGIGKSLVASLLTQYLQETGYEPMCFDTDPVNRSLAGFAALHAEPINLLEEDGINVVVVDAMIERVLQPASEVVIDNGAASFLPLSRYLIDHDIAGLIEAAKKQMFVHAIIVGGGNTIHTGKGLDAILRHFPASVRVVVWLNEAWGAVEVDGVPFEQTPLYLDNRDRIAGIITLHQQNPQTFGVNIRQMLDRKLTFAEALADTAAFMTVPRQRLTMYRRQIWTQLAAIL